MAPSLASLDQEIAWLAPATSSSHWERLLSAVKMVAAELRRDSPSYLIEEDDRQAFPEQTTTIPEIALSFPGKKGRLWLRWYKLTSDLKIEDWTQVLLGRNPPPLAVIGGNASDEAIELAGAMKEAAARLGLQMTAPLLLTQTTVDELGAGEPSLSNAYPGRIFRICFTDKQMARLILDFLWSHKEFCPDAAPVYLAYWDDDPYSKDLNQCFCEALPPTSAQAAAQTWCWQTAVAAGLAFPVDLASVWSAQFRSVAPESCAIYNSVGTYSEPNRWEEEGAWRLMETKREQHPEQQRPLLIVPAAPQPTRRFLRALTRIAPQEARRYIVAGGDSIAFNTLYRDRNLAWPIQDLPFSLVLFSHRNPVDTRAGFVPESDLPADSRPDDNPSAAGTEDLLLYTDLVNVLFRTFTINRDRSELLPENAEDLRSCLGRARWCGETIGVRYGEMGTPLFDSDGNRHSGTGEHIVALRPHFQGDTVLPESTLEVWKRTPGTGAGNDSMRWERVRELSLRYEGYLAPE
jgi:hypothetical protein